MSHKLFDRLNRRTTARENEDRKKKMKLAKNANRKKKMSSLMMKLALL
jgi:hypothetical protein